MYKIDDFETIKKSGQSIVLTDDSESLKDILKTESHKLRVWVKMTAGTEDRVQKIVPSAGRVSLDAGAVCYTSIKNLEHAISDIGSGLENVEGFILPLPQSDGPIWDEEFEMQPNTGLDDILYDLFEEEKNQSSVRSWYFENAERYIREKYMIPQKDFLNSIGKKTAFYLEKTDTYYTFINKIINPIKLKRCGFLIAADDESSKIHDLFIGEYGKAIMQNATKAEALLVVPIRGVAERYVYSAEKKLPRIETPALAAAIEGVYYSDMLVKGEYSFDVIDEFSFGENVNFKKYKNIIICESCLFSQKEMKRIEKLKAQGVKINDEELMLSIEGEEEWEK